MKTLLKHTDTVLLIGDDELVASAALCLLNAGHQVNVCTLNPDGFRQLFNKHLTAQNKGKAIARKLTVDRELCVNHNSELVIAITPENEQLKNDLLKKIENIVPKDAIIAINTESIALATLHENCAYPDRVIGLNWTEPAHTTHFLEIITTNDNADAATEVLNLAKSSWNKDPYICDNDGIRGRLISAMAREASYLVDNGYASVDDIDRACRNDAGYYLPFCGNCRYMDLMGTYAYGMVMKDLNPDLSKDTKLPEFMKQILQEGGLGMENKKGFYSYSDDEVEKWKDTMEKFSYEIQSIIEKYPFNYTKETTIN